MTRPTSMPRLHVAVLLTALLSASDAGAQSTIRFESPAVPGADILGGASLAALGGNLLVGAPGNLNSPDGADAVHLYDGVTGAQIRTYLPPAPASSWFGWSVAAVGGNVLVGAPFDGTGAPFAGAAHLLDGATSALLLTFPNPSPAMDDQFGSSVAALGGNVLVGAPGEDTGATDAGAVYLFDGGTGALLRTFPNPAPAPSASFGRSVAELGGNVLVGAPNAELAYLLDSATGAVLQTFVPPASGGFGFVVAAIGGNALVGAPFDGTLVVGNGAAHLFDGATGALLRSFANPTPDTDDAFGWSVAGAGGHVIIGAIGDDTGARDTGAAYVFDASTGALVRTLLNPTPASFDTFGWRVAGLGNGFVSSALSDATTTTADGASYLFCGGAAGCGPCETCGPGGTCTAASNPTCRPLGSDGFSRLRLVDAPNDSGDQAIWSWRGHGLVDVQDFGHPLLTHDYTLCVFDGADSLVFRSTAPADGTCGSSPCWRPVSTNGFSYRDRDRTPDGMQKILARGVQRDGGQEMLNVKARGELLTGRPFGLPALPPPLPLKVQIQARDGWCWEATYSAATTSTSRRFVTVAD